MTFQNPWLMNGLRMIRATFEAGKQSMDIFQQQIERNMDLLLSDSNFVNVETRQTIQNWMENVAKARKTYMDTVEEGLNTMEGLFSTEKTSKK